MAKTFPAVYSKLIFKGLGKDLCSTNANEYSKKYNKKGGCTEVQIQKAINRKNKLFISSVISRCSKRINLHGMTHFAMGK